MTVYPRRAIVNPRNNVLTGDFRGMAKKGRPIERGLIHRARTMITRPIVFLRGKTPERNFAGV